MKDPVPVIPESRVPKSNYDICKLCPYLGVTVYLGEEIWYWYCQIEKKDIENPEPHYQGTVIRKNHEINRGCPYHFEYEFLSDK